jgi:hypothetical protein
MISAVLLALHAILFIYAFITYKKESVSEGLLAMALVVIVFAVGWTMTTMLTNLAFTIFSLQPWYASESASQGEAFLKKELNRDTISLFLLSSAEAVFYYVVWWRNSKQRAIKAEAAQRRKEGTPDS